MATTDSGFMEVLTGKPRLEGAKIALFLYFSNKYFNRYCAMGA